MFTHELLETAACLLAADCVLILVLIRKLFKILLVQQDPHQLEFIRVLVLLPLGLLWVAFPNLGHVVHGPI